MTRNRKCIICLVTTAFFAWAAGSALPAAPITILNHSFQSPVLDPNKSSSTVDDWTTLGGSTFSYADFGLDPRPDGTSQNAHTGNAGSFYLYQTLGTNVQPNTTYTLTVDVGDRDDHPFLQRRFASESATPMAST